MKKEEAKRANEWFALMSVIFYKYLLTNPEFIKEMERIGQERKKKR